jgi:hypothetical protein
MLFPHARSRLLNSTIGTHNQRAEIRSQCDEPEGQVEVEYLGRLEIAVTGRFTGRLYRFNPIETTQPVDRRDAFYLLASRRFGVAS